MYLIQKFGFMGICRCSCGAQTYATVYKAAGIHLHDNIPFARSLNIRVVREKPEREIPGNTLREIRDHPVNTGKLKKKKLS